MCKFINVKQNDILVKDKDLPIDQENNISDPSYSKSFSYSWLNKIWKWADDFNLSEEETPRNRDDLEDLKHLIIDTTYHYSGYYTNTSELPEDYISTPLYHMKEVPAELTHLEKLETVYLRNVDASKFVEKISNLSYLKEIDLFSTNIKRLPSGINKIQNLKSLSVWESELIELPETICEIDRLKLLDICAEKISKLPSSLGKLKGLKQLTIKCDSLSKIPNNVFQLSQLECLHISGKKIPKIQTDIKLLENLKVLEIYTSNINSLPKIIGSLHRLNFIKTYRSLKDLLPNNIDTSKVEIIFV